MTDEKKIAQYNAEMAEYANRATQYLNAFANNKSVTREQAREMANFVLAQTKKDIVCKPFASQEEKDVEIRRRENLVKIMKSQTGL